MNLRRPVQAELGRGTHFIRCLMMMEASMRLFGLACLAAMFSSGLAFACSCADFTPRSCNLLANRNESIFVGTVIKIENPPKEGDRRGGIARYHFRVKEWLSRDAQTEVDVFSGRGEADCSFWFKTGVPYLVFAYRRDNGELWAGICSNTQLVADASPLLAQLRAMHNGQPVARVYGTVRQVQQPYDGTHQPNFDKQLAQVTLHFVSPTKEFTTTTANDGSFAVYDMPSGTYQVTGDVPPNLELAETILSDPPPPLQLDANSCVERDVDVLPTGKIRGQLLGSDGKPLWNAPVELFSADRYREDTGGWWEFVDDKKKYFEFDHVAPGEYVLVFNRKNDLDTDVPYPRTFFPGASDLPRAEHIRVGPGVQLLHANIQLNGGKATRRIRIRVRFKEGGEPTSSYLFIKGSRGEDAFPSPLEENLYELNVLLDSEYTITAQTIFCDPETESSPLKFLGAGASQELTITVPDTKCKALPNELRQKRSK